MFALFVGEAVTKLGASGVFTKLDKEDELSRLFVEDAAATLSDFVKTIPLTNHAHIITEAFNSRPAASRDGFANSNAAGRTKVWEMTWITDGLRQEMAQSFPGNDSVVAKFAAELNVANHAAADKLRNELIALIPLVPPTP